MKKPPIYTDRACGCQWQAGRWLKLCDRHDIETREIHERWKIERVAQQRRAAEARKESA